MTTAPVSFGGLESGLNTSAIISAEMAVFEQPLNALEAQQTTLNTQISDYQTLNSQLLTLQQAADALAIPSAYAQAFSTSSSNSSIATGTVTSGTSAGSMTLAVDQLATGSTQISAGTVAATDDVVASGNLLVGLGGLGARPGLHQRRLGPLRRRPRHQRHPGVGRAPSVSAGSPLAASTTITGANDEIDVDANGTPMTIDIAAGTYTPAQLAQAITQASGRPSTASVERGRRVDPRHHATRLDGLAPGHRRVGPRHPRPFHRRGGQRHRRPDRRGWHDHDGQRHRRHRH